MKSIGPGGSPAESAGGVSGRRSRPDMPLGQWTASSSHSRFLCEEMLETVEYTFLDTNYFLNLRVCGIRKQVEIRKNAG